METEIWETEFLEIGNEFSEQQVIPIIGDGACLFRALSFLMFNTQERSLKIRKRIVKYVAGNWDEFGYLSHNQEGDNHECAEVYAKDMGRRDTYGGLCELMAAGRIYPYLFEVYRGGILYFKAGIDGNPIKRLKFSSHLASGHFDAYLPVTDVECIVASSLSGVSSSELSVHSSCVVKKNRKKGKSRRNKMC